MDSTDTNTLHIQVISNPLTMERSDYELEYVGQRVTDVVEGGLDGKCHTVVAVNGRVVDDYSLKLKPDDWLVLSPRLADPVTAGIAAIWNFGVQFAVAGTTYVITVGSALTAIGLAVGAGLLARALAPRPQFGEYASSPSFGWDPHTVQRQGAPIPKWYGKNLVYGNIINCWRDPAYGGNKQQLNCIVALGLGPIESVSDIKLQGRDIDTLAGVSYEVRYGTLEQTPVALWDVTKLEFQPNILLTNKDPDGSVTGAIPYEIPGSDYDSLELIFEFREGFFNQRSDGSVETGVVDFKVEIAETGGGYTTVFDDEITGKSQVPMWKPLFIDVQDDFVPADVMLLSNVIKVGRDILTTQTVRFSTTGTLPAPLAVDTTYYVINAGHTAIKVATSAAQARLGNEINITTKGTGTHTISIGIFDIERDKSYTVRVTKNDIDRDHPRVHQKCWLGIVHAVVNQTYSHPGLAHVGISAIAAEDISGRLEFSCITEGSIVQYHNGAAWVLGYSENPAAALLDVLTEPVISGAGTGPSPYAIELYRGFDDTWPTLSEFLTLYNYHATLADDGKGGTEPRFTFNWGFETAGTRWEAAMRVATIARCSPYIQGNKLRLAIDMAKSLSAAYSVDDIFADSFNKSLILESDRASEITVQYRNEDENFEQTEALVFDDSVSSYKKTTLDYRALIRTSEVWRAAKFDIQANSELQYVIEWDVGTRALASELGDRVSVSHPIMKDMQGGKVVAVTATGVYVSCNIKMTGGADKLVVQSLNESTGAEETYSYDVASASDNLVTIVGAWTVVPKRDDPFVYGPTTWVTDGVTLTRIRRSGELNYRLTGIQYSPDLWDYDTQTPVIPSETLIAPLSSKRALPPATWQQLGSLAPQQALGPGDLDDIMVHNVEWEDNTPGAGYIAWRPADRQLSLTDLASTQASGWLTLTSATGGFTPDMVDEYVHIVSGTNFTAGWYQIVDIVDENTVTLGSACGSVGDASAGTGYVESPMSVVYRGTSYEIDAGNTDKIYTYWDLSSETSFSTTDTQTDTVGADKFALRINDGGTNYPALDVNLTTPKVIDNAITDKAYVYTATLLNINTTVETTLQSLAFTAIGDVIHIQFSCAIECTGGVGKWTFRIYRDAVKIYESVDHGFATNANTYVTFPFTDEPAAGSYTYYVKTIRSGDRVADFTCRSLYLQELKK